MRTAIIFVSGGLVQNIITDDPDLKTIVIDSDADGSEFTKTIADHDNHDDTYRAHINDDAPQVNEEYVQHYLKQLEGK